MNPLTPTFIQTKTTHLKKTLDQMHLKVSNKEDKTLQLLRISFISFLDQSQQKLQTLIKNQPQTFNAYSQNLYSNGSKNQLAQYRDRYFESQKQRIQLQKKLTQLLQKQIRQQQHALKLQRADSQSLKQKSKLQSQVRQLHQEIQQLNNNLNNHQTKTRDQQRQIHRIVTLNHRLDNQRQKLVEDRNRSQRKVNQLMQKYQQDQMVIHNKSTMKGHERFTLKNTQGIRNVRIVTNVSTQKKNMEKYFVIQLPAKLEIQKIVYGIRIGILMPNKQIVYFNDLHLYEKDPMRLEKQGDSLAIDYLKRKEKVFVDQHKMTKPQVLILLYGKGDSVMIDESN